jgi:cytochrome c oxidase assembly protein Cox11
MLYPLPVHFILDDKISTNPEVVDIRHVITATNKTENLLK